MRTAFGFAGLHSIRMHASTLQGKCMLVLFAGSERVQAFGTVFVRVDWSLCSKCNTSVCCCYTKPSYGSHRVMQCLRDIIWGLHRQRFRGPILLHAYRHPERKPDTGFSQAMQAPCKPP